MSKTRFALLASAAQTATAQGGGVSVSGIKSMAVCVDVTGVSSSVSIFMQGSYDGGTTFCDLPYDLCLDSAPTTHTEGKRHVPGTNTTQSTGNNLGEPGCRNIIESTVSGTTRRSWAKYTNFGDYVRVAWVISGSGSTHTFSVSGIGEN